MRYNSKDILKVVLPLLLAAAILWWMYRGFKWDEMWTVLQTDMSWTWMLLSFPFGISAQVFRALRWRQALAPLGDRPRLSTCIHAVFLSYFSSLIVPRVGEILRCGVLNRYEGTNLSHSVGTVVTERVVDMSMVLLFSLITVLTQIPVFMRFFRSTGVSMSGFLQAFSASGYLVTGLCLILILLLIVFLLHRLNLFSHTKGALNGLMEGLLSVRHLKSPVLFLVNTVGIWLSYYLHFYVTFYCFSFTENLGAVAALVAFVVGCFAVLVPTPNGAGPWHFAVKTVLVLYGVNAVSGALFALVVHTTQTLLIVVLGLYALLALAFTKRRNPIASSANE